MFFFLKSSEESSLVEDQHGATLSTGKVACVA